MTKISSPHTQQEFLTFVYKFIYFRTVNKENGEERRILAGLKKLYHPTRILKNPFQVRVNFSIGFMYS